MMKIMRELLPTLLTQEQLSLSANKVRKFESTVIPNVEFYSWIIIYYLSRVLIGLSLETKKEISQWIMQTNNIFFLARTLYKINNQIHGKVCPHALGLWK